MRTEGGFVIFTTQDTPNRCLIMDCDPVNQWHGTLSFGLLKAAVCECKLFSKQVLLMDCNPLSAYPFMPLLFSISFIFLLLLSYSGLLHFHLLFPFTQWISPAYLLFFQFLIFPVSHSDIAVEKAFLPMAVKSHVCFPNHLGPQAPTTEGEGEGEGNTCTQEINSVEADGGLVQTEDKTAKPTCECSIWKLLSSCFFRYVFSPLICGWKPQSPRNKGEKQTKNCLIRVGLPHTSTHKLNNFTTSSLIISKLFFKVQYISLYTY